MMKKEILGLALALITAGLCQAVETVMKVRVEALDGFKSDTADVLAFCNVREGSEVSQVALSKDVRALLDTGRFSYVDVEVLAQAQGVEVIYKIQRRYRYQGPMVVTGAVYFSESKLSKFADIKDGDPIDEQLLAVKAAKIRDEYIKKYFPFVQITAALNVVDKENGISGISFGINEGMRAKFNQYAFNGNSSIPAKELRATFGSRPWWDPRGWFSDTPITEQDLDDARVLVRKVYLERGYQDVVVSAPRMEPIANEKVDVVFDIQEGPQYAVDSIAVKGITLFPEMEVTRAMLLKAEDTATSTSIESAAKVIKDYYGSRGYVDTQVVPQMEAIASATNRLALSFTVRESEQVSIRNVVIRGNSKTKDKVIRREVLVNPGEIANDVSAARSENRLQNLNYFKTVRHYYIPVGEDGKRDLVYEVEEQKTGNFMIGIGFSSIDSVVGYFEIRQSNFDILNWPDFTGGGQKARLGVEYGPRRETVEVQWTEPWLFNRPLALTTELYRRMRWYDQYDEIRTGASAALSYPVALGRIGFMETGEQIEYDEVEQGLFHMKQGIRPNGQTTYRYTDEEDGFSSRPRIYWTLDRRNQVFVPTKGYQISVFGEAQGDVTGSEWNTYSFGASYRHWTPLFWKTVLNWRLRYETVDAYGSTDEVPLFSRYFLGGGRTIRGFEYRSLGPKMYSDPGMTGSYEPYGGLTMAVGTIEYTIPLFEAVRWAFFTDFGCLGSDFGDPDFGTVYASIGTGIRIDIPGFPIRLDLAVPYNNPDDSEEEVFTFWIGFD